MLRGMRLPLRAAIRRVAHEAEKARGARVDRVEAVAEAGDEGAPFREEAVELSRGGFLQGQAAVHGGRDLAVEGDLTLPRSAVHVAEHVDG